MRRVVAEQIEALSELNAIVRAQPASHDLIDRRPAQPQPRPSRQPEPQAYQQPARQPEPVRETYRPEPARSAIVDPIRTSTVAEPPAPVAAPAPQPAPVAAAPRPEPVAAQPEQGGGWLRDVLRNASANQAGTQPQGLSGLTDEIIRSIDNAALADAWSRYQAGESNVFTRRIYSLTGQGTYDEVRKRIQRDPDFTRTAQAYMSEFEQLLKRAAAGPNAAAETREHLLSDRGKVYTTLAHASGRLA
jgi:outer membrane biosynthesis protein TonB